MKYVFSDFYLLMAADRSCRTVGTAFRRMSELMGIPVSSPCLLYALEGLCAGGYATLAPVDGVITADTPLSLTNTGKDSATVSALQKFFGEDKALNRKELRFCSSQRPHVETAWTVDETSFAAISEDLLRGGRISAPLFALADDGNGALTVTLRHPDRDALPVSKDEGTDYESDAFEGEPQEVAHADAIAVTGPAEDILQGVSQLLEVSRDLMVSPRTRKVAFHGAQGSYVITLAHAASEYGTALRLTVTQIRFNRRRFYGKRDSDLDYAQCGDPLITTEMNGAREFAARLLPCAVSLPEALGETERQIIEDIHRKLKA